MKAAITDGRGRVWLEETPIPTPNEHQCLCKMLACATCTGTDLKHIDNRLPWEQRYPGILGHESIGRVVKAGARVRRFRVGDLVLRPTAAYPGESLAGYSSLWGGFAEYGLITDIAALKADQPDAEVNPYARYQLAVPDLPGVEPRDWTMTITLKETAGYLESVGVRLYRSLAILGSGAVALSLCRLAKILGAYPVVVVGRRDAPLRYAREVIGADFVVNSAKEDAAARVRELTGGGADFLIDTTGDAAFAAACAAGLNETGKIAGYATYPPGDSLADRVSPERLIQGQTGEDAAHQYLIDCVRLNLLDLKRFYSHALPFARIAEGFEMLRRKEAFKIVFEIE